MWCDKRVRDRVLVSEGAFSDVRMHLGEFTFLRGPRARLLRCLRTVDCLPEGTCFMYVNVLTFCSSFIEMPPGVLAPQLSPTQTILVGAVSAFSSLFVEQWKTSGVQGSIAKLETLVERQAAAAASFAEFAAEASVQHNLTLHCDCANQSSAAPSSGIASVVARVGFPCRLSHSQALEECLVFGRTRC